jgi:nucleotide-binding universal stress UspA family protein
VLDAEPAQIVVRPSWGRADALLVDLGRMANADVMLVGGNQWHGLGRVWHTSISRGILHHAPTNVLIAPKTTEQVRRITPIQRVLVATDFSPIGNEAVPHAYSLVGEGGEVCLLHVITSGTRKAEPARAFERAAAGLEALVPAKTAARGIKTDVEVEQHDTPADAICQAAERFGADVICLGSHGRSGWQAAMLGSVAQQVLARGQRPVYIVRAPAE